MTNPRPRPETRGPNPERMLPLRINPASQADRDWAAALMARNEPWLTLGRGLEQCRTACHHPDYLMYMAQAGAQRCGFLLLHRRGVAGSPYVATLAVAEALRGQGLGRRLLAFAEQLFAADGARHLFLCVSSFNTRARALYERCGYTAVGEFADYIVAGASEILMCKRLEAPGESPD